MVDTEGKNSFSCTCYSFISLMKEREGLMLLPCIKKAYCLLLDVFGYS